MGRLVNAAEEDLLTVDLPLPPGQKQQQSKSSDPDMQRAGFEGPPAQASPLSSVAWIKIISNSMANQTFVGDVSAELSKIDCIVQTQKIHDAEMNSAGSLPACHVTARCAVTREAGVQCRGGLML